FSFLYLRPSSTDIFTLSLHDALPIFYVGSFMVCHFYNGGFRGARNCYADASFFKNTNVADGHRRFSRNDSAYDSRFFYTDQFALDRKSTRLNSSHVSISYAVFCLKKK